MCCKNNGSGLCVIILLNNGMLGYVFREIYGASTKSSETKRKEINVCWFRRRVIYYVRERGELHEKVFSSKEVVE